MKDIMNCQYGTLFTGKEINEWCKNQIESGLKNKREAKYIVAHYTFSPDGLYRSKRILNWSSKDPVYCGFERIDN